MRNSDYSNICVQCTHTRTHWVNVSYIVLYFCTSQFNSCDIKKDQKGNQHLSSGRHYKSTLKVKVCFWCGHMSKCAHDTWFILQFYTQVFKLLWKQCETLKNIKLTASLNFFCFLSFMFLCKHKLKHILCFYSILASHDTYTHAHTS